MDVPTTIKNKQLVEKKREQIVLAAIKLFSAKGFHGTTLRELAEESGLSYGNIYDYVGSKEDIFSLIHDFVANKVMETLLASIENISDPVERLRRIVRGEFDVMDQWSDAILLIYQESHILAPPYLHKLLIKEREHVALIEQAVEQAAVAGKLRKCNTRLAANFIKSMVDTWVIKRWDLRGFATRLETEKGVLDFVFNGLLNREEGVYGKDSQGVPVGSLEAHELAGKTILIANGGTVLGSATCNTMLSRGATIAIQYESDKPFREHPNLCAQASEGVRKYQLDSYGPMTTELFRKIDAEVGPIDFFVYDLGLGLLSDDEVSQTEAADRLAANLALAEDLAAMWAAETRRLPSRVVFLAPWSWDQEMEPFRFKTVRAGIIALTKALSKTLAPKGTNVNCIVPGYIKAARPSSYEKAMREELSEVIPSGCLGETADVTDTIGYLVSDASKYITGQVFQVSGGMDMEY